MKTNLNQQMQLQQELEDKEKELERLQEVAQENT
jgi:hypothetical protein